MSRRFRLLPCALVLSVLVLVAPAWGQAPPDGDFQVTTLAKGADKTGEPIAMTVLPDRSVLHTSRDGRVWRTTANATTALAGTIPVYSHDEDGLQGIAIDDDFATNRWVYVYYSPPLSTPGGDAPSSGTGPASFDAYKGANRLSRFKLAANNTLDLASQQVILEVPTDRGICCHNGGEIDFDAAGNLYLSTGDDSNPFESDGYAPIDERLTRNPAFDAQRSSANTNDLRGKLLRIKVAADGTYTIPAGNLFAPGTMGTRPEIYAMGFRNPFRFAVDDETGWVMLGDYGPDAGGPSATRGPGGQVEFNLIKGPGNYGWPYCHGKNDAYNDFDFATNVSGAKYDCAAPVNNSPRHTGLANLPPAQPAWIAYDGCNVPEFGCGSESPMGGETYHFDAANTSPTKFPEYYDGKNFSYEFGRGWIRLFNTDAQGALQSIEPFMDSFDFKQLINAQFGPDGSFYVLDYGTGNFNGDANSAVYRIDYVQGTRSPTAVATADKTTGPAPLTVAFSAEGSADPDGTPVTYAWDLDGDGETDSTAEKPTFTYEQAGRYTATLAVTDGAGQTGNASVNIVAGNTAPTVTLTVPPHGGMFEYGDTITYSISVTDAEDGAIDCDRVRLDTALGHNEHTHGDQSRTGCTGTITIPGAWEDKTQHIYYLMSASYTDDGGSQPGLELTGRAEVHLEWKNQQAEFADAQSGTQTVNNGGAAGGIRVGYIEAGDWLRYDDVNLSGIDSVIARVTSTSTSQFQLRSGSVDGPVVATVNLPSTGGVDNYVNLPAVPVDDPGGTHDLYVVFTDDQQDLDELTFVGQGVTGNASPVLTASATPTSGSVPLTVDFEAEATDPEGTAVTYAWDFGVTGAPTPATPTASYTYTRRGTYLASVTATDADGRKSVRTFTVSVLADCDTGTDQFDGNALDTSTWSIVREDANEYRVQDGGLVIDAVAGDMYGGNTSARNLIGQPAPAGGWTATTKVSLAHVGEYEQAAMLLRASDQQFLKLAYIRTPNGRNIEFIRQRGGQPDDQGAVERSSGFLTTDTIFLRMQSDGTNVTAAYSPDGATWTPVGRTQPLDALAGATIGISAFNGVGTPATFDFFTLTDAASGGGSDEFDGTALDVCRWTDIVREDQNEYRVQDGKLEIDALDGDMYADNTGAKNLIMQPAPSGAWEAVTKVTLPQGEEYEQAGLMVHQSDDDFAKLVLMDIPNVGWRVEFGQNIGGGAVFDEALDRSGALPANVNVNGLWLKVVNDGSFLTGHWSADGTTWTRLGRARSVSSLPSPSVGLAAYNGNGQAATFDFFHIEESDVEPACQEPAAPDAGYRMLYDNTAAGLAEWRMSGPGGFSLQPDCSILSFGGLGLLWHPEALRDYSLKLDWKMAGDDNAGVFVGFQDPGSDPFNAVNSGHEIQIDATDDADSTTGAIYNFKAPDAAARDAVLNPPGEWNAYELVVIGQRIQVFLNGVKINDYVDTDPNRMNQPSFVGLQNHGTGDDVYFRDVQVKDLDDPGTEPPSLSVTAPADGTVVDGSSVTVTGTTDGERVELQVGATVVEVTPAANGSFSGQVSLALGANQVNVTAFNADDVPTSVSRSVVSRGFGARIGGLTDPEGDDDGPGTYVYPTDAVFVDGAFDLAAMDVYDAGDQVRFVTTLHGDVTNPFGGNQLSLQRVNIYVGGGDGAAVPALPGTNMNAASPWDAVIVQDGRFDSWGVFGADGTRRAPGTLLAIPQTDEIVLTVPKSALGGLDLASARYGVAMFGNAEGGEGIGFVRPVYDFDYWNTPPGDKPWIKQWRFGGGAGEWVDTPAKDTDTRDPNALDVIVGEGQNQAEVLDWETASPTAVPMLALPDEGEAGAPVLQAFADPTSGEAPLAVNFTATAIDPDGGAITYRWQLADGAVNGAGFSRTFTQAGTYEATVTATDDQGQTASKTVSVTVTGGGEPENGPPEIVEAEADVTSGPAPLDVLFNAVADDPDGDALTYSWDFDDGGSAFGAEADHTFDAAGTYDVTLTVSDPDGASDSATITITATDPPGNRPPSVQAGALPASGPAPLAVLFTAAGSDPDGDVLTYAWDFGDGSAGTGRRARHTYAASGTYTAKVTVKDVAGATGTAMVQVVVGNPAGNQAPTVQIAADRVAGTAPLLVRFSSAGVDPDGDALAYVWDFGDGGKAGGPKANHTYTAPGTYTAKVTVTDAGGKSASATTTITVNPRTQGAGAAPPRGAAALAKVGRPSLATFVKRGIKVAATCGTGGGGRVALWATKGTKRKLGLRSRGMGRATLACAAGGRATVRVRPSRAVRRAIRAARPGSLKVTVVLGAGDGVAARRTVVLR
ncbi:MAG: PKD domain-containing protein [Solirubrobacteraceae bacterium]